MMLYMKVQVYPPCTSSVHKFEPQGLTGVAMLGESHISVHTWPEKGMAVCDAFTCGETYTKKGVEYMKDVQCQGHYCKSIRETT